MNKKEIIPVFKPSVGKEEIKAVAEVIKSGWLGLGPKTQEFEKKFAEYVGSKYAIATNSCTAALDLSLKALGINSGEVLVPSLTFAATANVALYNNAKPVFVDVYEDTLTMDVDDLKRKITRKTRAIIPMHYGGHPCEMDEILEIARDKGIPVIEDAAHACGAEYKGKKIGSLSDVTCFSFHPVKNLSTGDGGIVTTNDKKLYERIKKLRWFCINKSTFERTSGEGYTWYYEIDGLGYKYHMNDVMAAIALVQLKKLDRNNRKRRKIATFYTKRLKKLSWLETPVEKSYVKSSWHLYVIKVEARDALISYLDKNGISTSVHYMPVHLHPFYRKLGLKANVPVTEKIWKKLITLPIFPDLTRKDQERIIRTIEEFKN